jgi:hypothetical protein
VPTTMRSCRRMFREQPQAWLRRRWYRLVGGFSVQDYRGRNTVND